MKNQMRIFFDAVSENEAFARLVAAGFFAQLNPTLAEITDVKTAVSEAVTNAIIHGYEGKGGTVELFCAYDENRLQIEVADRGIGITNITQAMEPLYTSKPELERSAWQSWVFLCVKTCQFLPRHFGRIFPFCCLSFVV